MEKKINGEAIAREIKEKLAEEIIRFRQERKIQLTLVAMLVGWEAMGSRVLSSIEDACVGVGVSIREPLLPGNMSEEELVSLLHILNQNKRVNGIVLCDLPNYIDKKKLVSNISTEKDVEGLHPINLGRLLIGKPALEPPVPLAIIKMLESLNVSIQGMEAVVIEGCQEVALPTAAMLINRFATVTVCNPRDKDIRSHVGRADIVVASAGEPEAIKGEWIKNGAVVIEAVQTPDKKGIFVGDVELEEASKRASAIARLRDVEAVAYAMLMSNLLKAALLQQRGWRGDRDDNYKA